MCRSVMLRCARSQPAFGMALLSAALAMCVSSTSTSTAPLESVAAPTQGLLSNVFGDHMVRVVHDRSRLRMHAVYTRTHAAIHARTHGEMTEIESVRLHTCRARTHAAMHALMQPLTLHCSIAWTCIACSSIAPASTAGHHQRRALTSGHCMVCTRTRDPCTCACMHALVV